ncbi:MAG: ADP-glyceromanno-heptose 6-epimerase [Candidatus Andersenbacteria bacterium]
MIIITGAAGFIGSALLWALNQRGEKNILLVDNIDDNRKERNISSGTYKELLSIEDFHQRLRKGAFTARQIQAILHMGAISSTTETDWQKLQTFNVEYTQDVIRWCVEHAVRCIYASSGQTYGRGEQGFSDATSLFDKLKTTTLYGQSKLLVDIWARDAGYLEQIVGLRYFNVFGPNEQHKKHMRSVIAKQYDLVKEKGVMELFRSYRSDYPDGGQQRDFLYIKDAVAATLFFLDNVAVTGMYNVGTGNARSWNEVAGALFATLHKPPAITYVEMPEDLKAGYQYFTQADITALKAAGFTTPFMPLEEAVADYVGNYLERDKHLGE